MAGPTCGVLVPSLSGGDIASLREALRKVGILEPADWDPEGCEDFRVTDTRTLGGRYFGEQRPFLLVVEQPLKHSLPIPREFGDAANFPDDVGFAAMCNDDVDHQILAEVALWVAERFSGIIDFGGALLPRRWEEPGDLLFFRPWEEVRGPIEEMLRGLPGLCCAVPYTTASGKTWASHFGDATFLRAWMKSEHFQMVK